MAAQVSDVPEGVWLRLKESDDNGSSWSEGKKRTFEELDKQFLVIAYLSIYVCALATDVWEVEDFCRPVVSREVSFFVSGSCKAQDILILS